MAPRAIDSGPQSLRKGLPAVFNSLIVDGAQTCRCVQRECMKGITWRLSRVIAIAAERFHPRWLTDSFHVRNETDGQGQTGGDRPSWFGQRRKLAERRFSWLSFRRQGDRRSRPFSNSPLIKYGASSPAALQEARARGVSAARHQRPMSRPCAALALAARVPFPQQEPHRKQEKR